MKISTLRLTAALLLSATAGAFAQSTPADFSQHAANASRESAQAGSAAAGSAARATSAAIAVPLLAAGHVAAATGQLLWNAAEVQPAGCRPAMNSNLGLPPAAKSAPTTGTAPKPADPAPALAMKSN